MTARTWWPASSSSSRRGPPHGGSGVRVPGPTVCAHCGERRARLTPPSALRRRELIGAGRSLKIVHQSGDLTFWIAWVVATPLVDVQTPPGRPHPASGSRTERLLRVAGDDGSVRSDMLRRPRACVNDVDECFTNNEYVDRVGRRFASDPAGKNVFQRTGRLAMTGASPVSLAGAFVSSSRGCTCMVPVPPIVSVSPVGSSRAEKSPAALETSSTGPSMSSRSWPETGRCASDSPVRTVSESPLLWRTDTSRPPLGPADWPPVAGCSVDLKPARTAAFPFRCGQIVGTALRHEIAKAPRSQCFQGVAGLRRWR